MALSKLKPNSFDSIVEGNPSLIINGDMVVSQRGSQSAQQTGYSAVDRFKMQGSSAARFDTSQSTDVPSGQGFSNSLKLDCSTADTSLAAGDFQQVKTILEGQDLQHLLWGTSSASNLTLTFWVKSPKTGTHNLEIEHTDASQKNTIQYSITTANTWQKVTLNFDGYQTTNFNNDNGSSLIVTWWLIAGSTYSGGTYNENTWHNTNADRAVGQVNVGDSTSNDFYLTGVKLEIGSIATPFQHESYSEILSKCYRYYVRYGAQTTSSGLMNMNVRTSGSAKYGVLHFPTKMRAVPSIIISSASHYTLFFAGSSSTPTAASYQGGTLLTAEIYWTASGGTSGDGGWIRIVNTAGYLDFDAEL